MTKPIFSRSRFRGLYSILLAACFSMLLAACAGANPPAATATVPAAAATMAPAPTLAPEATATSVQVPPTAAVPQTGSNPSGPRTFQIVPEQSEVSYEVQEQFLNRSLPNMAVGKTQSINGTFQVSLDGKPGATVTEMQVDLRTLTSDENRRDRRLRTQWLESDRFPLATFVSSGVEGGPDSYTEGQEVTFKLPGTLTVREISLPVVFDVTARLEGDTITGAAVTQLMMKDFGIDPPDIAGFLRATDGVTVRVNFTAKEVQ